MHSSTRPRCARAAAAAARLVTIIVLLPVLDAASASAARAARRPMVVRRPRCGRADYHRNGWPFNASATEPVLVSGHAFPEALAGPWMLAPRNRSV